eukprot:symbB.v1.2.039990.t2/scaffold6920.1/size14603/2
MRYRCREASCLQKAWLHHQINCIGRRFRVAFESFRCQGEFTMAFSSVSRNLFTFLGWALLAVVNAGCDWSSHGEFCKNWKTCACGDIVTVKDVGALVLTCVVSPPLCVGVATKLLKEKVGTSVGQDLVKQMLQGNEVQLPDGNSAKAAVLSGTGCHHCPIKGLPCIPQPNEHRVCVAWNKQLENAAKTHTLVYIRQGPGTGTSTTEIHKLTGGSSFKHFSLQKGTLLPETDYSWSFGVKFDGTLAAISRNEPQTVVRFVDPSAYSKWQYMGVILHENTNTWDFYVKPNGDIVGCKLKNTGTGSAEIHVVSAASGFSQFSLQTGTGLPEKQPARGVKCFMKANGDFVNVFWWWTGSGKVEVHVASASSGYKDVVVATATPLPQAKPWSFAMAPNGDVYCLRPRSDGHVWAWLLKASDYSKVAWSGRTGVNDVPKHYQFLVLED